MDSTKDTYQAPTVLELRAALYDLVVEAEKHSENLHWLRNPLDHANKILRGDQRPVPLEIPESAWKDSGIDDADPKARLLAHVVIGGVSYHAEAFEVHRPGGVQCARSEDFQPEFGALELMREGDDGPFAETTIGGRQYVIVIAPYCE